MKHTKLYLLALMAVWLLQACGGGSQQQNESTQSEPAEKSEPAVEEENVADSIALEIEGDDNMQFNKSELKVTEGQIVILTLKHTGTMDKDAMGHNWVLLANSTEPADFGTAATSARDTDYIPQDRLDDVIAHTQVIGGGEQTSITFLAPKPGYYKFICSFPGHWGVMQGTFVVQPR